MNFPERDFTTTIPARKRRRWIAAAVVAGLVVGGGAIATYWYLRVCGNCSPILCTDPCTLPTFSQAWKPSGTDA
jgi:hypothetical protein